MSFTTVVAALLAVAVLLTTLQLVATGRLLRKRRPFAAGPRGRAVPASSPRAGSTTAEPAVSILKPLCGLEDGLEENLASFAALTGVSYEVILSVEDGADPCLGAVARVRQRFPEAPFRLVVGGVAPDAAKNPKVARLMAAARVARGEVLFVSDANVRVEPGDVAETVALFSDPSVGCVSNLFVGDGARDLGSTVESLHLLTFVAPGAALADLGGVPCVVGKSMALPRRVYEAIGGFSAFADVLAEDQAIGLAVKAAGWRVVVSPVVVKNVVERRTLRAALARQVRWGMIRFAFSKAVYSSELFLNPFGLACLGALASAFAAPGQTPVVLNMAGLVLLIRLLQGFAFAMLLGSALSPVRLLALPLKDLFQLYTQAVPYGAREVVWRGHRFRVAAGTRLRPAGSEGVESFQAPA